MNYSEWSTQENATTQTYPSNSGTWEIVKYKTPFSIGCVENVEITEKTYFPNWVFSKKNKGQVFVDLLIEKSKNQDLIDRCKLGVVEGDEIYAEDGFCILSFKSVEKAFEFLKAESKNVILAEIFQ